MKTAHTCDIDEHTELNENLYTRCKGSDQIVIYHMLVGRKE